MPQTNAERQRKYRDSRQLAGDNGERLIHTYVTTGASLALARLAKRYGVTRRAMLEKLILDADEAILGGLDFGSPELTEYLERR